MTGGPAPSLQADSVRGPATQHVLRPRSRRRWAWRWPMWMRGWRAFRRVVVSWWYSASAYEIRAAILDTYRHPGLVVLGMVLVVHTTSRRTKALLGEDRCPRSDPLRVFGASIKEKRCPLRLARHCERGGTTDLASG